MTRLRLSTTGPFHAVVRIPRTSTFVAYCNERFTTDVDAWTDEDPRPEVPVCPRCTEVMLGVRFVELGLTEMRNAQEVTP